MKKLTSLELEVLRLTKFVERQADKIRRLDGMLHYTINYIDALEDRPLLRLDLEAMGYLK